MYDLVVLQHGRETQSTQRPASKNEIFDSYFNVAHALCRVLLCGSAMDWLWILHRAGSNRRLSVVPPSCTRNFHLLFRFSVTTTISNRLRTVDFHFDRHF